MSILVTEPSPEVPTPSANHQVEPSSTLVHVLVHRESEEYQTDLEDSNSPDGKGKLKRLAPQISLDDQNQKVWQKHKNY